MQEYDNIFKNFKNYYLFYIAKHENSQTFLKEVFLHPKLLHQKNSKGESLSHLLCFEGMTEKYLPYIEMGGENSLTQNGNNVLHYCVSSGADTFLMIDLINHGVNPLQTNIFHQTPMHMLNSLQAASYFTNWNFRTFSKMERLTDIEGNTIAHSAAINKHKDILLFLLKEYPQLANIKNKNGLTPMQIFFLISNPLFNSHYYNSDAYKIFSLDQNNPEVSFLLYGSDNAEYEVQFNLRNILVFEKNKLNKITPVDLNNFIITRNKFSRLEKIKPLSLQLLKVEAKEIFKDSIIHQNEITEIYKDMIEQRSQGNMPEHNFNFDISKNFM